MATTPPTFQGYLRTGRKVCRLPGLCRYRGNLALWKLPATATAPVVTLHTLDVIRKKVGVFAATVDPSGRWLAAGTADGSLLFWDLWAQKPGDSGVVVPSFMHHGRVTAMAFSRKGDKLYSVGGDKLLLRVDAPEQAAKPLDTQQLASAIQVVRVDGWGESSTVLPCTRNRKALSQWVAVPRSACSISTA
nr:hypothetical protein [Pseudomonas sp. BIGb0427]